LDDEQQRGFAFVDPCVEDLYTTHAKLDPDTGKLKARSKPGEYTIREIRLNRRMFNKLRKERIAAQEIIPNYADTNTKAGSGAASAT
jgi:hypothetical protein